MKANLRDGIYLAIIIVLIAYAHDRDYKAMVKPQVQATLPKAHCAERDYIGRRLVASYYAYSDLIQTKRCTYRSLWT